MCSVCIALHAGVWDEQRKFEPGFAGIKLDGRDAAVDTAATFHDRVAGERRLRKEDARETSARSPGFRLPRLSFSCASWRDAAASSARRAPHHGSGNRGGLVGFLLYLKRKVARLEFGRIASRRKPRLLRERTASTPISHWPLVRQGQGKGAPRRLFLCRAKRWPRLTSDDERSRRSA